MSVLAPLEQACSWVLINAHSVLVGAGLPSDGGAAWAMSIVALVLVVRTAVLPLGIRQARAQQRMWKLAPQIEALRKKYRHNKRKQQEALAALLREHGASPLGAFLPVLLQAPILFALFRLLHSLADDTPLGLFASHPVLAMSAASASLWGAAMSASLRAPGASSGISARLVIGAVIAVMALITYLSARHSLSIDVAPAADDVAARVQRLLPYLTPIGLAFVALSMPLGVVLYWCSSAAFGYAQQIGIRRWLALPSEHA